MLPDLGQVPRTKVERLADLLRHGILEGRYVPHSPFPSLRKLADQYDMAVRDVQKAVGVLEKEGLLYRRERRGTFVRFRGGREHGLRRSGKIQCVNVIERPAGTVPSRARTSYLAGYTDALEGLHIKMRFVSSPADEDAYLGVLAEDYSLAQQGCVLLNVAGAAFMRWLDAHKLPFVVQYFMRYENDDLPEHHHVFVNKIGGVFEATQHLIARGHQRIGFIGWIPGRHGHSAALYEGYLAALRCAGLDPVSRDVLNLATDEIELAVRPAREFLERVDRPTAVVAQSDAMAIAFLRAARQLGIGVPHQLSVIGMNDQPEAADADPPLTTVAVPERLLGRTAMEILLAASEGRLETWQRRVLSCYLVVRSSTAPRAS